MEQTLQKLASLFQNPAPRSDQYSNPLTL